tara:strand:- start:9236 stop:10684 length:1449 start_codon:yes stop_codon:yes gene_type:complete
MKKKIVHNKSRFLVLFIVFSIFSIFGCTPDNNQSTFGTAGPIANSQANLFLLIFAIAVVVFIAVEAALIYISIKFRRKEGDKLPYQTHGNTKLEITWTIIPAVILIFVAIPTLIGIWSQQNGVPDDKGQVLNIEAVGHQWWFEFRYSDYEVITSNELHIPKGRPVSFKLSSQDVIHSFWVPKIAGKVDMVPLNDNYIWMIADEVGEFYGQCAEFCGTSHAHMRFRVFVHEEEDFLAWVDQMHTPADPPLPNTAESRGQMLFAANCSMCHTNNSTTPGSYIMEINTQDARWNNWIDDTENSALVSAPNLTHFGTHSTLGSGIKDLNHETLVEWIADPSSIKQGTRMQKQAMVYNTRDGKANLTDGEISDIATYLLSLKPGSGAELVIDDIPADGVIDAEAVFATNCAACHSLGNDVIVGPGMGGIKDRAADRVSGLSAYEYIYESIVEPQAYIVEGYPPVMPGWASLGDETVNALVEYLLTLE